MERKSYSVEFKKEAVRQLELRGKRSSRSVAEDLGVKASQLFSWRKQYQDAASSARLERGESLDEEVIRLRRELSYSRRQEDI